MDLEEWDWGLEHYTDRDHNKVDYDPSTQKGELYKTIFPHDPDNTVWDTENTLYGECVNHAWEYAGGDRTSTFQVAGLGHTVFNAHIDI